MSVLTEPKAIWGLRCPGKREALSLKAGLYLKGEKIEGRVGMGELIPGSKCSTDTGVKVRKYQDPTRGWCILGCAPRGRGAVGVR